MSALPSEVQQRLGFIDRTIGHAARACHSDLNVPVELRDFVHQLGLQTNQAMQAVSSHDPASIRQTVAELAQLSFHAQRSIRPADGINYDVKSAVILAHIEVWALKHRLD